MNGSEPLQRAWCKYLSFALLLGLATHCVAAQADEFSVSEADAGISSASPGGGGFSLGLSAGAGELNPNVSRNLTQALGFGFSTEMVELALGPADPNRATLDYFKATYFGPNWVQGSFNWFGLSSIQHYGDVDGFTPEHSFEGGFEFLPLNTKFLESPDRGYLIFRPTIAIQQQICALRIAPMVGRGYGLTPGGSLITVGFSGFDLGIDGKLSSSWLTGRQNLRIQSGASIDLYEDLSGHLGQVAAAGTINDDTMTGLAYLEVVLKTSKSEEWALGWKASYDRLSPYDPGTQLAARNEDTAIALYLRWSASPNVGSPVVGSSL